jgi:hypothetical protein
MIFGPSLSIMEVAKYLYSVLKNSVFVSTFDFSQTTCGISDQFLSLLLAEFFATYMIRHKVGGTILNLRNCPSVTVNGLVKFVETIVSLASSNGGISGPLRIQSDMDEGGIARVTDSLTSIGLSVAYPPAPIPSNSCSLYLG